MSPESAALAGDEGKGALTLESFQRYLDTEAQAREATAQRNLGVITRFFRIAAVLVCLNMVIAGANVAMIATRSGGSRSAPPASPAATATPAPTPPTSPLATSAPALTPPASHLATATPAPTPPPAATYAPAGVSQISQQAQVSAAQIPPATIRLPTLPEKRVPLLGPLPASFRPALARHRIHAQARPVSNKPVLSDDDDEEIDTSSHTPVERW
jgi:hypothetical protein